MTNAPKTETRPLADMTALQAVAGTVAKTVLVFLAVLLVFLAAIIGRIVYKPLDITFLRPTLERTLTFPEVGMRTQLGTVSLQWSTQTNSVFVRLQQAQVIGDDGKDIAVFNDAALSPSWTHLLLGQFKPSVILLQSPMLSARRLKDGSFDFGIDLPESAPADKAAATPDIDHTVLENLLATLGRADTGTLSGPLSSLRQIEIRSAQLGVSDDKLGSEWVVPLVDMLFTSTQEHGVRGDLDVYFDLGSRHKNSLSARIIIPPSGGSVKAAIQVRDLSSRVLTRRISQLQFLNDQDVQLNGLVQVLLSPDLKLKKANVDVTSSGGVMSLDVYDGDPVPYQDFHVKGTYDDARDAVVNIDNLSINIAGVPLRSQVDLQHAANGAYRLRGKTFIDRLVQDDFKTLWPPSLHYIGAYEWLSDKISDGAFTDAVLDSDIMIDPAASSDDAVTINHLGFDFKFDDMRIDYRAPLTPVTHATGRGHFDYVSEMLRVFVDSGKIGKLDITHGDVELSHIIESGHGDADIYLGISGQVADVFSFLQDKPIGFDHGYDLAKVKGTSEARINIQLPTHGHVTMDDVALDVRGKTINGHLPGLLKDADLARIDSTFQVYDNHLYVSGNGRFLTQDLSFKYDRFLESAGKPYKEKGIVKGTIDTAIRRHFDIDLSAFFEGPADTDFTYTDFGQGRQSIDLSATIDQSRVFVEPLGYEKPPGDIGHVDLLLDLKHGNPVKLSRLNVTAPHLDIRDGMLNFTKGMLSDGLATGVSIGDTAGDFDFTVDTAQRYRLNADLTTLDLRALIGEKNNEKPQNSDGIDLVASIRAKTALTHKDAVMTDMQLYLDREGKGRFRQFEIDAHAGTGSVYLRYKPDAQGVRKFRFEADDAGATLMTLGLYQNIRGGKILVHAEPTPEDVAAGNLLGVAEISNFTVVEAPTLAKILSLASIDGFSKGLTEEGIAFERLETQFDWQYRPEGSLLVLEKGRTSGAAIALTFDGLIDQSHGSIDVSGTVVPMSQINNFIGAIPLIGPVLTGGSGVFAATYTVKGKSSDPKISINPLSVLAPGILRQILFE